MKKNILLLTILVLFGIAMSAPSDPSFVVSSKESSNDNGKEGSSDNVPLHPIIYEMDITSNISNRFAKTLVVSKVKNSQTSAKEATFTVVLPEKAFISEFVMEIGGKSYKAYVKEKEEAKNIYNAAVQSGLSAAHVSVSARDSNKFTVSVNVEPESKAVFLLTYEELLERKNNQYELVINIHPGQIVKELNVKVQINESRPLKFVKTPSLRSGNEISKNEKELDPLSDIKITNSTTAVVKFNPDSAQQKQFASHLNTKESEGLSGQFIVQYEVERDPHGGEVLLQDGYFVHFFAPNDLEPLPKHVVFVLDTSGSMGGRKIVQLKDAMKSILNEIKTGDIVDLIEFGSVVNVWDIVSKTRTLITHDYEENYEEPFHKLSELNLPVSTTATNETLEKAKRVVEEMYASGGTNIIGGLQTGLYLIKVREERVTNQESKKHQPILIFLTDGDANVGVSSTEEIVRIVTNLNTKSNNVPIYSLSFGNGANKEFLRKLSLKNQGFSRHIYEASDASLQLQEFFRQISSPLLANIKFKYNSDVKDATKSKFPIYYGGSELIITGRYEDSNSPFRASVICSGLPVPKEFIPTIEKPVTSLERLWAYLTIKQILEERELAENKTLLSKKALDLALKFSFVTDVTSLVVVKPNETTAVTPDEADGGASPNFHRYPMSAIPSQYYSGSVGPFPRTGGFASPARRFYGMPVQNSYHILSATLHDRSYIRHKANLVPGLPAPSGSFDMGYTQGPYSTTTVSSTSKPRLQDTLPWLSSHLNPNGTITVAQDVYELGENSTNTVNTECSKTPVNSTETGTCSLLKDCPEVHSALIDFQVYQQYFCPIDNKFAGVCCPKKHKIY